MKRIVVVLLVCMLLTAVLPSSAEAYITKLDDAKGWWGDDSISYTFSSEIMNATYAGYMSDWSAAVSSWNRADGMPLTYSYSNYIYSPLRLSICYADHDATFGITNTYFFNDSRHVVQTAECFLNLNAEDKSVTIDDYRVAQSAAAHELGHVSGLKHDNSSSSHLMNVKRDRSRVYLPDQDSIDGVIFFYRDWNFDTWLLN